MRVLTAVIAKSTAAEVCSFNKMDVAGSSKTVTQNYMASHFRRL